jgi:hypothetical protein
MKSVRIATLLGLFFFATFWGLGFSSCSQRAKHPDGISINYSQGLDLANQVAKDLIEDNAKDLFGLLDEGFATRVNDEKDLEKVLHDMYKESGKPLLVKLKACQTGYRADGTLERPRRSFWYACVTSKYPWGQYFIKVEVVPSNDNTKLGTTGFGIITFPQGIPLYLQ